MSNELNFGRIEAGQYSVSISSKLVGYVKKQSSTKWALYKCSNLSMLGNPIAVKKTLTLVKQVAPEFFVEEIETADLKQLDVLAEKKEVEEKKKSIMKEMLERGNIHPDFKIEVVNLDDEIDVDDENFPFPLMGKETHEFSL